MKMKDFVIKAKTIKQELIVLLVVFVSAFGLNIYSIIHYKTSWAELYSQLHITIILAIVLYLFILVTRAVVYGLKRLSAKIIRK